MTDTAKQNTSNALYRFMSDNIIGSEEHVQTIRMMNAVRDNLQCGKISTPITSGSFGEGLEIKSSDFDIMEVLKQFEICEDAIICYREGTVYFRMQTDDTHPGYTQLQLLYTNYKDVLKDCKQIGCDYYFSNLTLKQQFVVYGLTTVHGPCITDVHGKMDMAYCLHSKSWIPPAEKWITRSKSEWPMYKVKQSIVKHGVLLVPIGVKGSLKEELEWRISFSVGEKLLLFTFTHTQLLCYALMKILLKDVIASDQNVSHLLCSYFMKTVMFWISEEISSTIWKPENLISCFMGCFQRLIYYVKFSVCPHYFIPENNLFENKIKGQVQEILMNNLNILYSRGWQCILFSEQFAKFDPLAYGIYKDPRFLHVCSVEALSCTRIYYADQYLWDRYLILENGIHRILSTKTSKIKSMYAYYISKLSYRCDNLLLVGDPSKNKSTYKQYNACVSTLLLSTRHDAVSGWLLLASSFYRRKEYNKAVDILMYCLSICTQEKICIGTTLSNIQKELINLPVFREMTSVQFTKFLLMGELFLTPNSLVPDELQIEGEDVGRIIPPVVYVYFLGFLCHYHLNSTRQCRNCLRDLQLTIEKNNFIADTLQKAISYEMLGILFQLKGDIESARQAFMQSIKLDSDKFNDANRRLSLIS